MFAELLHRTDFFPGLGWMLTRDLWLELEPKWPISYALSLVILYVYVALFSKTRLNVSYLESHIPYIKTDSGMTGCESRLNEWVALASDQKFRGPVLSVDMVSASAPPWFYKYYYLLKYNYRFIFSMNFWGPFLPIIFEEFSDQINTIFRDKQSFIKRAVEGLQKYQYLMFIYHKYITSVFLFLTIMISFEILLFVLVVFRVSKSLKFDILVLSVCSQRLIAEF